MYRARSGFTADEEDVMETVAIWKGGWKGGHVFHQNSDVLYVGLLFYAFLVYAT